MVKFSSLQFIKQHCVWGKYMQKSMDSQVLVTAVGVCKKIKSVAKFDTIRKRRMPGRKKLMIKQVNLAVEACLETVIDVNLKFYQELFADSFDMNNNAAVWYNSKKKLVEIWTRNKEKIVNIQIKSLLLPPPPSPKKKKRKKMIKKILNQPRNGIKVVVSNRNVNSRNHRNIVNNVKNRNHNNR